MASLLGFDLKDAASIAIIGAADGPTSIFVASYFESNYIGAIIVAAYSYMALVPIVQPPVIRLVTTKKERLIRMPYKQPRHLARLTRILFPIVVTVVAGHRRPRERGADRLFDVRQPDPRVRRAGYRCPKRRRRCWPTSSPCCWASPSPPKMQADDVPDAGKPC